MSLNYFLLARQAHLAPVDLQGICKGHGILGRHDTFAELNHTQCVLKSVGAPLSEPSGPVVPSVKSPPDEGQGSEKGSARSSLASRVAAKRAPKEQGEFRQPAAEPICKLGPSACRIASCKACQMAKNEAKPVP